jgi:membrane dipeptidase
MNTIFLICLFFISVLFKTTECQSFEPADSLLYAKAVSLSKEVLIADTHIDLPDWLFDDNFDISKTSEGEFDYVRAVEGGLNLAFLAVYTSPNMEGTGLAKPRADSLLNRLHYVLSKYPDQFDIAGSTSDVLGNSNSRKVMIALAMENGSPVQNDLENLREYYKKGVRYLTLAHYRWNHISDSANDPERKWNGLSPFGEEVVKEMNRLGMMIDVSHISDSAFYDVIRLSKAPVIASHSSLRHFVPGNERNMSDEMIKVLAENGGVIQINFAGFYLVDSIYKKMEALDAELKNYLETHDISASSKEGREYSRRLRNENPLSKAALSDAAGHIDHAVKVAGVDHVGIGSDYNGVGDNLPIGLEDVSKYPNLIYELLSRGYSDDDIRKIFGGNVLRVWKKVEDLSGSSE